MTNHRTSAHSDEQPIEVGTQSPRDEESARAAAWWESLGLEERLTFLRSVSIHETIFGQAVWDELPAFVRLALTLRLHDQR
jgi:hypothetical protein